MIEDAGVARVGRRTATDATGAFARAAAAVRQTWPMWILAVSLNGFFVYLAAFEALAVSTTSASTGIYYVALCVCLLTAAWTRRAVLAERLRSRERLTVAWIVAAVALAVWFVLNTALLSEGPLGRKLVALLVLWTIPTALVAFSLRLNDITTVAYGLLALGFLFIAFEAAAIIAGGGDRLRFTPISNLDPISAGLVPALGAISALSLRTQSNAGRALQLVVTAVLVAGAVIPGSRGPVLALLVAALATMLAEPPPFRVTIPLAVAVGLAVGVAASSYLGSLGYLTSSPRAAPPTSPAVTPAPSPTGCNADEPIPATEVLPPDRLSIHGQATYPDVTRRAPALLTIDLHVSCRGKDVHGAAVVARVAHGGRYTEPSEVATDAYGWARVKLRELDPDARGRQPQLVVSVRARRAGEDVFTGVTAVGELTVSTASQDGTGPRPRLGGR